MARLPARHSAVAVLAYHRSDARGRPRHGRHRRTRGTTSAGHGAARRCAGVRRLSRERRPETASLPARRRRQEPRAPAAPRQHRRRPADGARRRRLSRRQRAPSRRLVPCLARAAAGRQRDPLSALLRSRQTRLYRRRPARTPLRQRGTELSCVHTGADGRLPRQRGDRSLDHLRSYGDPPLRARRARAEAHADQPAYRIRLHQDGRDTGGARGALRHRPEGARRHDHHVQRACGWGRRTPSTR